ncbi:extracellular calcium-sensing receptor-like [Protopterus annectens]|uniref:extracellular calcium-sensing receptor-like n=1 Tax=Protopterus annectens TaxID=7888 RepID=UPI001CFB7894|nr:extracellular calcium-sensing receptor-like [Protopterus annectens]
MKIIYSFSFRAYRWVQSMVFAIEEINQNPTFLPNLTLGFRIYDTCLTVAKSLHGTVWMLAGQDVAVPNYSCHGHTPSSSAAIIGDSSSGCTIPMIQLLGLYLHPLISYFASTPLLNDRHLYPSFYRTIPSDEFQAQGLAQMVNYFGWTWVGLLAQDDEYGKEGTRIIKAEIIKAGGCIAFDETVPLLYSEKKTKLLVDMIEKSSSRAIVFFCFDSHMLPVIEEIFRKNITQKIWIASESWSSSSILSQQKYMQLLSGTIGFAVRRCHIPGLGKFLLRNSPLMYREDIFVKIFWEEAFGCVWSRSDTSQTTDTSDTTAKLCTGRERLETLINAYTDISDLRITCNVYNAVYAVVYALNEMCVCNPGEGPFYNGTCTNIHGYKSWQLLHYIEHLYFTNSEGEKVCFDHNGNSQALYDILNWQVSPDGTIRFVQVGRFNGNAPQGQELIINVSAIAWAAGHTQVPHSFCTESCRTGYRKASQRGQPLCCFDCLPCSQGEIANQTDSVNCIRCPDDQWPNVRQDRCFTRTTEFLSYEEPLGTALAVISVICFSLTVVVLGVFVKYRDTAVVKANNRELSYTVLFAVMLCSLCSLLFIGQPTTVTCRLRQPTFGVVFSFSISCVLAKTITVVIAFKATKPNSSLRRWMGPKLPAAINFACSCTQLVICIIWLVTSPPFVEHNMKVQAGKVTIQCNEGSPYAFWGMLGYNGLLAAMSFTVAFLGRKLPDSFNEAKFITFSMIVFLSVWLSFIPAYLSTSGKYMVGVEVFAILSSSAGLLACIFFPKCYIILLRPEMNSKDYLMGKKTTID